MSNNIKKNINKPKASTPTRLYSLEMNNYVIPNVKDAYNTSTKYVMNGINNGYYKFVQECYRSSATNAAVINNYVRYIYGDGLIVQGHDISDILKNTDIKLFVQDFKMQGQAALQVIYNVDRTIKELCYIPIDKIAIKNQADITAPVEYYSYCYDWEFEQKFGVVDLPAFGTSKEGTELLFVKSLSKEPFYSLPDYQTGLQFCRIEEEISNYFLNHILNGLSAGYIINVFGVEDTPESQAAAERAIVGKLTGSNAANRAVLSYQDDPEKATKIESVPDGNNYEKYEFLTSYAKDQILLSHAVVNPILFGVEKNSGFSNNADEMVVALKNLYRAQINPLREQIIDGLQPVFDYIFGEATVYFEDFEELRVDETQITEINTDLPTDGDSNIN